MIILFLSETINICFCVLSKKLETLVTTTQFG